MNRDLRTMLTDVLERGLAALVLTNAMAPLRQARAWLPGFRRHGARLRIRVSLDHHTEAVHEAERGPGSWAPSIEGLRWLTEAGFAVEIAGRRFTTETEAELRAGYAALFTSIGVTIEATDPVALTIFPEMDATADIPEITEACWAILNRSPDEMMCASARMMVKRKDAARPAVLACTLLPYDPRFELGATLAEAAVPVALNHPHCARFLRPGRRRVQPLLRSRERSQSPASVTGLSHRPLAVPTAAHSSGRSSSFRSGKNSAQPSVTSAERPRAGPAHHDQAAGPLCISPTSDGAAAAPRKPTKNRTEYICARTRGGDVARGHRLVDRDLAEDHRRDQRRPPAAPASPARHRQRRQRRHQHQRRAAGTRASAWCGRSSAPP